MFRARRWGVALLLPAGAPLAVAACSSSTGAVPPAPAQAESDASPGNDALAARDGGFALGDADAAPLPPPPPPPRGDGHVSFRLPDARWYRLTAKPGSTPENLSTPMDNVSSGSDSFLNIAKSGDAFVTNGSRFHCSSDACLATFVGDLSSGELVKVNAKSVTAGEARPAISSAKDVIVYSAAGKHPLDLYALRRSGGVWGAPVLLTGSSNFGYHHDVAVAWDGSRAVFDCGADKYGAPPTSICEVNTDGSGFHEVLGPTAGPDKGMQHALHHPDYTPEGDIVFEVDWLLEQVWKVRRGSTKPVRLSSASETDDNSPCVLPDGRVVSLWLGRQGNPQGTHEIKVMNSDGSGSQMLLTHVDVVDIGIGCGD